jgi:hypothetical protein
MSRRREWEQQRSEHARVLESLAGVIGPRPAVVLDPEPTVVDETPTMPSNVVDLRARRALAMSGGRTPHDAA